MRNKTGRNIVKVLIVGQLPNEVGGNYTTGAAKVVYEISKQRTDGVTSYTYATNTRAENARKISSYDNEYIGYKLMIGRIISSILLHPRRSFMEWKHYRKIDHANPFRYAFYKSNLEKAINVVQPDIIHVNSIGNISPVHYALKGKRIPILLTCHGIFYRGDKNDTIEYDRYMGNIEFADAYTGLTQESLSEFSDILGVDMSKVTVIPNGVDCSKFYYSEEERGKVRHEHNVQTDTKVFLTVASIQERKGQMIFLQLLESLDINYQYWIIGMGPDFQKLTDYCKKNGIAKKVKLLGYRNSDQLYKYYSAADIYAHPSLKEGQALSEIEAYTTGLRTIVNKKIVGTVITDVTTDNYYVLDFEKYDACDFVNWINKDISERKTRTKYDWSEIAKRYADLYRKIL